MRRHLAPVALPFPLREIIERQFARRDAAPENEPAIAIIGDDIIALRHGYAECGQPFMSHSRNVEMSFALAIEILLAQIAVPALQQDREQAQFVFSIKSGHVGAKMLIET